MLSYIFDRDWNRTHYNALDELRFFKFLELELALTHPRDTLTLYPTILMSLHTQRHSLQLIVVLHRRGITSLVIQIFIIEILIIRLLCLLLLPLHLILLTLHLLFTF